MKKIVIIASVAVMSLLGCTKNSIVDNTQEQATPISFGTYVGNAPQTKGTSMSLDLLKQGSFGVYAFYKKSVSWVDYEETDKATPTFMNNVKVYWPEGASAQNQLDPPATSKDWTYDGLKYWPEDGDDTPANITFFAYAPYVEGQEWNNDSNGTITFELKNIVTDLEDFVYAARSTDHPTGMPSEMKAADDASIDRRIQFEFEHALSRIGFSARSNLADLGSEVTITEITVGTATPTNTNPNGVGFWSKADFQLAKVDITDLLAQADQDVEPLKAPTNNWVVNNDATKTTSFTLTSSNLVTTPLTNGYGRINTDDSYLFVIPQNFSASSEESIIDDSELLNEYLPVTVTYYVKADKTDETAEPEGPYELSGMVRHDFQQGKAYQIQIALDNGAGPGLHPIQFSVVDDFDWGTPEDAQFINGVLVQANQDVLE